MKIKELAAELRITSRELIERCRTEGVPAQNSITKLSIEQERAVRSWYSTPPGMEKNENDESIPPTDRSREDAGSV